MRLDILLAAVRTLLYFLAGEWNSFAIPIAGARQIATGLSIAKQRDERVFVTSMCIGSGMGMAAVFISEH